jgi:hypothetical protein
MTRTNKTLRIFLTEGRNWIQDVFEDAPTVLTDSEVIDGINRHYEGGWYQFWIDNSALVED